MSFRYYSGKTKRAIQILADLGALLVSYVLAIALRYYILQPFYSNKAVPSYQLYASVLFMLVLSYLLMAFLRKGKSGAIEKQDGFDTLRNLIKDEIALIAILFLFLFITKWTSDVSRSVIGFMVILFFMIDLPVRIKVRNLFRWSATENQAHEKAIVIAAKETLEKPEYLEKLRSFSGFDVVEMVEDLEIYHSLVTACAGDLHAEYRSEAQETTEKGKETPRNVVLCQGNLTVEQQKELITKLQDEGKLVYVLPNLEAEVMSDQNWLDMSGFKAKRLDDLSQRAEVFGVPYALTNLEDASYYVRNHVKELSGKYLCFSNVHTAVMAKENEAMKEAEKGAAIVFPDGAPIRRNLRHQGHIFCERVAGPDFMRDVFEHTRDGKITHFFYGSSQETLDKLKANLEKTYPGIVIKGMISPPYRALSDEEQATYIKQINDAEADIVWIGLGAPKQELWMQKYAPQIHGVLAGVGAGFDFHAGTIKRAPKWVQRMSLEWLYRLFQDPARLFKRYFVTNTKYLWYSLRDK